MQALYKFQEQNNRLPNPRCSKDADAMVQTAKEINETLESKVSRLFKISIKHLMLLSFVQGEVVICIAVVEKLTQSTRC